jgi:hypothetical protein
MAVIRFWIILGCTRISGIRYNPCDFGLIINKNTKIEGKDSFFGISPGCKS